MLINGQHRRTIGLNEDGCSIWIIDQIRVPHQFETVSLKTVDDAARAIKTMMVRGAPLIGATAAFGIFLAMVEDGSDVNLEESAKKLLQTRPTAVNLRWAIDRILNKLDTIPPSDRADAAKIEAQAICDEDVQICRAIGEHGLKLIEKASAESPGGPVNILTHCNAGWLATIDWGTATAPIYQAQQAGIDVHVWVDETRPRNQGASLTAYELFHQKVPHTLIVDNAGGHLMQHGMVDLCIVGTDRTTRRGDVCNKIGTYLKALAAKDNHVPFYVALPSTTIDWTIADGIKEVPIEERNPSEVSWVTGITETGESTSVRISPAETPCSNFAFDVTPAELITALITERGVCDANEYALEALFA